MIRCAWAGTAQRPARVAGGVAAVVRCPIAALGSVAPAAASLLEFSPYAKATAAAAAMTMMATFRGPARRICSTTLPHMTSDCCSTTVGSASARRGQTGVQVATTLMRRRPSQMPLGACEPPPAPDGTSLATVVDPALLAQLVEHFHGKEGVVGSSPTEGFQDPCKAGIFFLFHSADLLLSGHGRARKVSAAAIGEAFYPATVQNASRIPTKLAVTGCRWCRARCGERNRMAPSRGLDDGTYRCRPRPPI